MKLDKPNCLRLETHLISRALDFALDRAGNSMPARMAIIAITTNSSIRVKALEALWLNEAFIGLR